MTSLQFGYSALTIIMFVLIALIAWTAIKRTFHDASVRKRKMRTIIGGLFAWHLYVFLISMSGVIQDFSFPPRFALLLILPLFVFTGIFIRKNRNNAWIKNIPESWLIYIQSFRILVESLFVASVGAGLLHNNVTVEGYNYDMIFAFTAIPIGLLVYHFKAVSRKVALAWNYLGLAVIAVIIFLFMSTIYAPHIYGPDTLPMPIEATFYPYVLVAGFLMPLAVFVHVLSITQVTRKS